MGYWDIVLPQTTINLCENPSVEIDTTGYTALGSGSSIVRVANEQKWRLRSLEVTPGSGTTNGFYYGSVSLTNSQSYVASVYVKFGDGIPGKIYFANTSNTLKGTASTFTGTGGWQRIYVSWTCDSSASYRIIVTKNNSSSTSKFYVDGLQIEADLSGGGTPTTYCDGDQPGCTWNKVPHQSTSTRDGQSREGGKIINLDALGIYVTQTSGMGMPANTHQTSSYALIPGAEFQGRKIEPRSLTLVFENSPSTYSSLHDIRSEVINAMKPDLVKGDQPFILRYHGTSDEELPLWIKATYDRGLEGGETIGFSEILQVKLVAYDPFFYGEGDSATSLSYSQILASTNLIAARLPTGEWTNLDNGLAGSGPVRCMIYDQERRRIYVGGNFNSGGSGPTTLNNVGYWDFVDSTWHAMGGASVGTNGGVYCLELDAAGNLYLGGDFTTAGGTSVSNVAKYDPSTNAFSALGSGFDSIVFALCVWRKDGVLYAGGVFTASGATTIPGIAKYTGSAWDTLDGYSTTGVNGASPIVRSIVDDGSYLYIGGLFNSAYYGPGPTGITDYLVTRWDGEKILQTGGGSFTPTGGVYALGLTPDGNLWAAGGFSAPANNLTAWNGMAWRPVGLNNINLTVWKMCIINNTVHIGGQFTIPYHYHAIWNRSTWLKSDIDLNGTIYAVASLSSQVSGITQVTESQAVVYAGAFYGDLVASYLNTVLINGGTHYTYPVIYVKRLSGGTSVVLESIRNEETGKTLNFNYPLQIGEVIQIDTRPFKRKIVSGRYGTSWRAMQRASDFADFYLLPGSNHLSVKVTGVGSPVVETYLVWQDTFWSFDGASS